MPRSENYPEEVVKDYFVSDNFMINTMKPVGEQRLFPFTRLIMIQLACQNHLALVEMPPSSPNKIETCNKIQKNTHHRPQVYITAEIFQISNLVYSCLIQVC